jgi:hypothetical protein
MVKISDIFICQQCGYCCQGETTVSLDENDQKRMIKHLGKQREEVTRDFWRQNGNTIQMRTVDGHCIFYDNGCTIHFLRRRIILRLSRNPVPESTGNSAMLNSAESSLFCSDSPKRTEDEPVCVLNFSF